jgi:hypothetical protein
MNGLMAPFTAPKSAVFAGKKPQGPGSVPFGGQQWTRLPFLADARSTATTGAWPSPANTAAASSAAELPGAG